MRDVFSIINKTALYANVLILYGTTVEKTSMQRQKKSTSEQTKKAQRLILRKKTESNKVRRQP